MTKNTLWMNDANPEEQGSFCDQGTQHQYDNVNGFTAITTAQNAEARGDTVEWVDKSVYGLDDPSRPEDAVLPDDRYNVYMSEQDSQGVTTPSRHRPGR